MTDMLSCDPFEEYLGAVRERSARVSVGDHVYCNTIQQDNTLSRAINAAAPLPILPNSLKISYSKCNAYNNDFLGKRTKCEADTRPLARCIYST